MLQPIEAALNICCGGYTALVGQFKEAGERMTALQPGLDWPDKRNKAGSAIPAAAIAFYAPVRSVVFCGLPRLFGCIQRACMCMVIDTRCCCAARQNFNVVRMFGFPVQRGFNLQTSAGVYNEQVSLTLKKYPIFLTASSRDLRSLAWQQSIVSESMAMGEMSGERSMLCVDVIERGLNEQAPKTKLCVRRRLRGLTS